jgi:hypothetical protein
MIGEKIETQRYRRVKKEGWNERVVGWKEREIE